MMLAAQSHDATATAAPGPIKSDRDGESGIQFNGINYL